MATVQEHRSESMTGASVRQPPGSFTRSGGLPLEVEREKAFQDLGIGEVDRPALGG
jgi:hypothetical protein